MNKKPQSKLQKVIIMIITIVFVFSSFYGVLFYAPKKAQATFPTFDYANLGIAISDFSENIFQFIQSDLLSELKAVAFKNAVGGLAKLAAQESAQWIVSGAKGGGPRWITNFDDWIEGQKDALIGDMLYQIVNDAAGINVCDFSLEADPRFKVNITLPLFPEYEPPKPACTWTEVIDNWNKIGETQLTDIVNVKGRQMGTSAKAIAQEIKRLPEESYPNKDALVEHANNLVRFSENFNNDLDTILKNKSKENIQLSTGKYDIDAPGIGQARRDWISQIDNEIGLIRGEDGWTVTERPVVETLLSGFNSLTNLVKSGLDSELFEDAATFDVKQAASVFDESADKYKAWRDTYQTKANLEAEAVRNQVTEAIANAGWQGSNDFDGNVRTPASLFEANAEKNLTTESSANVTEYTQSIVGDAVGVFFQTLWNGYMQRLLEALANPKQREKVKTPSAGSSAYDQEVVSSESVRSYIEELGQSFTIQQSLSDLNLLQEFQLNLGGRINPNIYNNVIDTNFAQAIQRELTFRDAMAEGLVKDLGFNDSNLVKDKYHIANIKKLRKARVVPLGLEFAAEIIVNDETLKNTITLSDVLNGFDQTGSNDYCDGISDDPDESPFCGLVDPDWVLKLPVTQCSKEIQQEQWSEVLQNNETGQRYSWCSDLASCVKDDGKGGCIDNKYVFCVTEKNIWRFSINSCPKQFDSCRTYTYEQAGSAQKVSVLKNTLTDRQCNQNDVGCARYLNCSGEQAYFNRNVEKCDEQFAGCHAYIDPVTQQTIYYRSPDDACLDCSPGSEDPQCSEYITPCSADDLGCEEYQILGETMYIKDFQLCPPECADYAAYNREPNLFEQAGFFDSSGNFTDYETGSEYNLIYSQENICDGLEGCSEFVRTDDGQAEYYQDIRPCVADQGDTATFFTWQTTEIGTPQILRWNLKAEPDPLTGAQKPIEYEESTCANVQIGVNDLKCLKFYDSLGNSWIVDYTKTIQYHESCEAYVYNMPDSNQANCNANSAIADWWTEAGPDNVAGNEDDLEQEGCYYQLVPELSQTCPAEYSYCRAMAGGNATLKPLIPDGGDNFEYGTNGWESSSGTAALATYVSTDNNVLTIYGSNSIFKDFSDALLKGFNYKLSFSVSAGQVSVDLDGQSIMPDGSPIFTCQAGAGLLCEYNQNIVFDGPGSMIKINNLTDNNIFIDNIQLYSAGSLYLKDVSVTLPLQGDYDVCAGNVGCRQYIDNNGDANYFSAVVPCDVIGCKELRDTNNSLLTFDDDFDTYYVLNDNARCDFDNKGCQKFNKTGIDSFSEEYLLNDPDKYTGPEDPIACEPESLNCLELLNTEGQYEYYKIDFDRICQYQETLGTGGETIGQWFNNKTGDECDTDSSNKLVYDIGQCPESANGCTGFLPRNLTDTNDQCSQAGASNSEADCLAAGDQESCQWNDPGCKNVRTTSCMDLTQTECVSSDFCVYEQIQCLDRPDKLDNCSQLINEQECTNNSAVCSWQPAVCQDNGQVKSCYEFESQNDCLNGSDFCQWLPFRCGVKEDAPQSCSVFNDDQQSCNNNQYFCDWLENENLDNTKNICREFDNNETGCDSESNCQWVPTDAADTAAGVCIKTADALESPALNDPDSCRTLDGDQDRCENNLLCRWIDSDDVCIDQGVCQDAPGRDCSQLNLSTSCGFGDDAQNGDFCEWLPQECVVRADAPDDCTDFNQNQCLGNPAYCTLTQEEECSDIFNCSSLNQTDCDNNINCQYIDNGDGTGSCQYACPGEVDSIEDCLDSSDFCYFDGGGCRSRSDDDPGDPPSCSNYVFELCGDVDTNIGFCQWQDGFCESQVLGDEYYVLDIGSAIDRSTCTSVDWNKGCVEFKNTVENKNELIKVSKDRQCAEWVECTEEDEAAGYCKKVELVDDGRGSLNGWERQSGQVIDQDWYTDRFITKEGNPGSPASVLDKWLAPDYSGYSVPDRLPLEDIISDGEVNNTYISIHPQINDMTGFGDDFRYQQPVCKYFPSPSSPWPNQLQKTQGYQNLKETFSESVPIYTIHNGCFYDQITAQGRTSYVPTKYIYDVGKSAMCTAPEETIGRLCQTSADCAGGFSTIDNQDCTDIDSIKQFWGYENFCLEYDTINPVYSSILNNADIDGDNTPDTPSNYQAYACLSFSPFSVNTCNYYTNKDNCDLKPLCLWSETDSTCQQNPCGLLSFGDCGDRNDECGWNSENNYCFYKKNCQNLTRTECGQVPDDCYFDYYDNICKSVSKCDNLPEQNCNNTEDCMYQGTCKISCKDRYPVSSIVHRNNDAILMYRVNTATGNSQMVESCVQDPLCQWMPTGHSWGDSHWGPGDIDYYYWTYWQCQNRCEDRPSQSECEGQDAEIWLSQSTYRPSCTWENGSCKFDCGWINNKFTRGDNILDNPAYFDKDGLCDNTLGCTVRDICENIGGCTFDDSKLNEFGQQGLCVRDYSSLETSAPNEELITWSNGYTAVINCEDLGSGDHEILDKDVGDTDVCDPEEGDNGEDYWLTCINIPYTNPSTNLLEFNLRATNVRCSP